MPRDDVCGSDDDLVPRRALDEVLARVAALEAQVAGLRAGPTGPSSEKSGPSGGSSGWTRRALLVGGLGAAVGAAASVSGARPAQAAQNDYAVLGQSNSGGLFRTTFQSTSAYTTLEVTNPVLKAHALVANARDVAAIQGTAIATGGIGVEGICQAEQGIAQGTGVRGEAYQGVGVLGTSSVGVGVRGESTAGIGVSATAQTEAGARCSSGSDRKSVV